MDGSGREGENCGGCGGDGGRKRRHGGGRPSPDSAAKRAFLAALKGRVRLEDAAKATGFSMSAFYGARRRDPDFKADWADALELSALRERARRAPPLPDPDGEEVRIAANNRRQLQLRKMRQVRFAGRRVEIFLSFFAGTGDVGAAAEAAGVDESTVYNRYRTDPQFAADWDKALGQAYLRLEAEALRQRLEAQKKLREEIVPAGEIAAEFDRVMRLLDRAERRLRRGDGRAFAKVTPMRRTFDEAIEQLDRKLRALGLTIPPLPPEVAARYDLPSAGTEGTATFTARADSLSRGGAESDCP